MEPNDYIYIVIEAKSEDYHGTYKEIVGVYSTKKAAEEKAKALSDNNHIYDIEFYVDCYKLQ